MTLFIPNRAFSLPHSGNRLLTKISFDTCDKKLSIRLIDKTGDQLDSGGMCRQSWWKVFDDANPQRLVRYLQLFFGSESMYELLKRYGFQDDSGCVNHHHVKLHYDDTYHPESLPFSNEVRTFTGVPQFKPQSGVCWFASLCWIAFGNPAMRDFMKSHLPIEYHSLIDTCLYDRTSAEKLRIKLDKEETIGDDTSLPPIMDGKNGFIEFALLCAAFHVPLVRYEAGGGTIYHSPVLYDRMKTRKYLHPPKLSDPHLMSISFHHGNHEKYPLRRRIVMNGVRYFLVGIFLGQKMCGHQIGLCIYDRSSQLVIFGDADLSKSGIGCTIAIIGKNEDWHKTVALASHTTKVGNSFCPIKHTNPNNDELQKYEFFRGRPGTTSTDAVYLSCSATC